MSNFCQFPTLMAEKSAWYMLVLCRFFITFQFSLNIFVNACLNFFHLPSVAPQRSENIFNWVFLTKTTALLPF